MSDILRSLGTEFEDAARDAFSARQELIVVAREDTATMSPEDLHERLLVARQVVDSLEFSLVKALMAKSRADHYKAQCAGVVEDAEILVEPESTKDFSYLSARQRDIDINGKTIKVRRAFRQASTVASEGYFTVEAIKAMHRGADSYRREIETRLRAIVLTTSLER